MSLGSLARHAGSAVSVFRLAVAENRQASRKALPVAKHQVFRKVWLQAGLPEGTYFPQRLHLAKCSAHLAIFPEHFRLAIV